MPSVHRICIRLAGNRPEREYGFAHINVVTVVVEVSTGHIFAKCFDGIVAMSHMTSTPVTASMIAFTKTNFPRILALKGHAAGIFEAAILILCVLAAAEAGAVAV